MSWMKTPAYRYSITGVLQTIFGFLYDLQPLLGTVSTIGVEPGKSSQLLRSLGDPNAITGDSNSWSRTADGGQALVGKEAFSLLFLRLSVFLGLIFVLVYLSALFSFICLFFPSCFYYNLFLSLFHFSSFLFLELYGFSSTFFIFSSFSTSLFPPISLFSLM